MILIYFFLIMNILMLDVELPPTIIPSIITFWFLSAIILNRKWVLLHVFVV